MKKLLNVMQAWWGKRRFEAEMAEEMRLHVEQREREAVERGMSPEEARYAALRKFGGVEQVKEAARAQRRGAWLEQLAQDVRYAFRQFARAKGFTVVVVLTLALGIGATTAIYSVVDAVVLNPIPGPNSDRVVQIGQWIKHSNRPEADHAGLSPPTLHAIIENGGEIFSEVAWADGLQLERRGEDFSTVIYGEGVSENFFALFGAQPLLGRTFAAGEAIALERSEPAGDAAIVLTYRWWQAEFGGKSDVLGRSIELGGKRFSVIGVMPEHFNFPGTTQFWLPVKPTRVEPRRIAAPNIRLIARLKADVSQAQVEAVLATLVQRLMRDYPAGDRHYGDDWRRTAEGLGFWCRPLREVVQNPRHGYEDLRRTLLGFLAAIGFVLLIVCANVANLTLARTERRQHELSVRAALGAGRGRLMRQLLTENLVLAAIGGVAGLFVAHWGMQVLATLNTMPRLRPIELDGRVLTIASLVTLLTGLIFGLAPAWQAGRARVREALGQGGLNASVGLPGRKLRSALVVVEVALAVVLLTGAGLVIQSVVRLLRVDPGFDPVNLVKVAPDLTGAPGAGLNTPEKRNAFFAHLHERLAALPGVQAVGIFKDNFSEERFLPEGHTEPVLLTGAHVGSGESDYFRAARVALLSGRFFEPGDLGEKVGTVIVNETLAEYCWPGQSALGKKIHAPQRKGAPTYEVIGVVRDTRSYRFDEKSRPLFYRPFSEAGATGARTTFFVRAQNDPRLLLPAIRTELRALAPHLRAPYLALSQQELFDATQAQRTYRNYLVAFAAIGLLLAALGIYGVLSYSVARRTRELGIRMALGADAAAVLRLVMSEGGRLVAMGLVLGVVAAYGLTQFLQKQLFDVSPHDPAVMAAAVLVLASVAVLACWLPARRATRVDPMVALRCE